LQIHLLFISRQNVLCIFPEKKESFVEGEHFFGCRKCNYRLSSV
jgi:hypothetical protein